MKITKSWFYKLSDFSSLPLVLKERTEGWIIDVWENIAITLFDDVKNDININIWKNSNVEFFWFSENISKNINIIQYKSWSKLHFRYLIYSQILKESKIKISSQLSWEKNSSNIKILSIVWENWKINLDGIIKIKKWAHEIKWKLIEDNLFLWNKWSIKWIPTLLVESDDVEASHACKIERISDEKLFYMRSRWIWKENAISMIIDAKVFDLFKCLSMINKEFYDELIENILKEIK